MTDTTEAAPTPESLLPDLRTELGALAEGVIDEHLLMFLHWKPSVERAAERFRHFVAWKSESAQGLFDASLRLSTDPELERLVKSEVIVAPPGLKTKAGGPILIGRLRNNDFTDGRTVDGVCRMLYYTVDRVLHRPETQEHGLTIVHDLKGFDKSKNARLELAKKVMAGLTKHFPMNVRAIYICGAPAVFVGFFKIVSILMPKKIRERVRFLDDLSELGGDVNPEDLLTELGGTLEFSIDDWVDEQKRGEESGSWTSLTDVPAATK